MLSAIEEQWHDECGVCGVWNSDKAAHLTALGMHALQHRGQQAAGIVSTDGESFYCDRRRGLVGEHLNAQKTLNNLKGQSAIGHVRYATTGAAIDQNIQPLYADLISGGVALAHNGNLTNALTLRRQLSEQGAIFQSTTDTEVIMHLLARTPSNLPIMQRLPLALNLVLGAYSLLVLTQDSLIAVRDPLGVRPLALGQLPNNQGYVVASESCAFSIMGAQFIRDILPGEMVCISKHGVQSQFLRQDIDPSFKGRFCIFEYVYFARPDSTLEGHNVYQIRKNIGRCLAMQAPTKADIVVPVPDSGVPAALGYAQESSIPLELGIIRNHYVGRTFIAPSQIMRDMGVTLKHSPNAHLLRDKDIVLVDDSIVRGTTSRKIVKMLRDCGVRSIHMRIASPPSISPCFYGVDTPCQEQLIAANMSVEQIATYIGADSLEFLSLESLYRAFEQERNNESPQFCDACFSGEYPIPIIDEQSKLKGTVDASSTYPRK